LKPSVPYCPNSRSNLFRLAAWERPLRRAPGTSSWAQTEGRCRAQGVTSGLYQRLLWSPRLDRASSPLGRFAESSQRSFACAGRAPIGGSGVSPSSAKRAPLYDPGPRCALVSVPSTRDCLRVAARELGSRARSNHPQRLPAASRGGSSPVGREGSLHSSRCDAWGR
jgi:hypothetical protein